MNFYALLVGINKYPGLPAMRWLQYCHSDVKLLQGYLEEPETQAPFDKVSIRVMTESLGEQDPGLMPTKDNVVAAIQSHLGQAQPGDTVLFYFSGHGAREKTSLASFAREELDGHIGGLVMHNFADKTLSNPGQTVLADKEVRYLIREIAKKGTEAKPVHQLVMFDCCHSGESTRAVLGDFPGGSRQIEREPLPARKPEEFFFCANDASLQQQLVQGASLEKLLPEGEHIMLAACREVELAWESGGNGAFTRALVDVLRKHRGEISYHELHSRVVGRMRFVQKDDESKDRRQTPQFYLQTPSQSDRYRRFLTNQQLEQTSGGTLEFNEEEGEWRLDLGALHGVPIQPASPTGVQVYPAGKPAEAISGAIKHVFPTYSTVDLFGYEPDRSQSWRGEVTAVLLPPMRFAVSGDADAVTWASAFFTNKLAAAATKSLSLVSLQDDPEWVLRIQGDMAGIVEPGPVALPRVQASVVKGLGKWLEEGLEVQYEFLRHIARWSQLRDLQHNGVFEAPEARFAHPNYPVDLRAFVYDPQTQTEKPLPVSGKSIMVDLTPKQPVQYVRFELVNRTPQELFVSLVYMPHTFGFLTKGKIQLMHKAQLGLGPMKEPSMEAGQGHVQSSRLGQTMPNGQIYLPFRTGAYIESDNWPGIQEYLKLLVSEVPFDLEPIHMDMLPGPGDQTKSRFLAIDVPMDSPIPKWELSTWSLYITNPKYEPVS